MKYIKVLHIPHNDQITLNKIITIKQLVEENSNSKINFIPDADNKTIKIEFIGDFESENIVP